MKNMMTFKNQEAYEAWTEQFENPSDYEQIPTMVDNGYKVSVDMFTECKSYKTALRRFEKTFAPKNEELAAFIEGMRETCEYGYFEQRDSGDLGVYSWGVEETSEGYWYIYLNISGIFAGKKKTA